MSIQCLNNYLVELFETVNNFTKRRQNVCEIGARDKFATHLR